MIHQYKSNGYNIVLDVNSGAVHTVDEPAYNIIRIYDEDKEITVDDVIKKLHNQYDRETITETLKEIEELRLNGELFTKDIYEDYIDSHKKRKTVVKALCLHIAHDCNLACRYCFAQEGEYKGKRELMSGNTGKNAIDFLIANSGNRINLEVDFFGGEPLMNFSAIKEIIKYARQKEEYHNKKFRFTLTTNGILLNDEMMEFINKEISNVVLSIDGRREVNDYMRPSRNEIGSYDIILPKFLKVARDRNQNNYFVRGTFTHYNKDFTKDVLHLADLGFKQISVEPVVSSIEEDYSIKEDDLEELYNEYDKLATEIIKRNIEGNEFNFFHFNIDLSGGPCVAKRLSGCGSGTEYLAVTPKGDLYPCHQFVGEDDFIMGNVYDGVTKPNIREQFRNSSVYTKDKCKECFAKFYCSGGCAANSYKFHGNINEAYDIGCELQKKRLECAIMINIALAE